MKFRPLRLASVTDPTPVEPIAVPEEMRAVIFDAPGGAAGIADGRGVGRVEGREQHAPQFVLVPGDHDHDVGHAAEVGQVVEAVVGGTVRAHDTGAIQGDKLVTHTFPLEDYEKAVDIFEHKKDGSIKVVINP